MGIFDKLAKKKKDEAETEEKVEQTVSEEAVPEDEVTTEAKEPTEDKQKEIEKENDAVPQATMEPVIPSKSVDENANGNRYTMLVEETMELGSDMGVLLTGNVHGTISVDDTVYVLHPATPMKSLKVTAIEVNEGQLVGKAANARVGVILDGIKSLKEIQKYSVITSIRPQQKPNAKYAVENPFLLGLTMEYPRLNSNKDFSNLMLFAVRFSNYITPVSIEGKPVPTADGKFKLEAGSKMTLRLLTHPKDNNLKVLPVFTDWQALQEWKLIFETEKTPKTLVMGYPDCAAFAVQQKSGFVINPYGPVSVFVPMDIINIIRQKDEATKKIREEQQKKN